MLNAVSYLAHANQDHSSTTESIDHLLGSTPYIITVWLVLIAAIYLIASRLFKLSLSNHLLAQAAAHLLFGIYLHDKHNLLAAVIISVGFVLILVQVVNGLSPRQTTKTKKKG